MKKILAKIKKPLPYLVTVPGPITPLPPNYSPSTIVIHIISWILWIAGALAVVYLIYGGIVYITASGNEDRVKAGKSILINAIIGIVIVVLAYAIVTWVANILKTSY